MGRAHVCVAGHGRSWAAAGRPCEEAATKLGAGLGGLVVTRGLSGPELGQWGWCMV